MYSSGGSGPESPCVSVCVIRDDLCIGCQRTLDEIARWSSMTNEERKTTLALVQERTEKMFD